MINFQIHKTHIKPIKPPKPVLIKPTGLGYMIKPGLMPTLTIYATKGHQQMIKQMIFVVNDRIRAYSTALYKYGGLLATLMKLTKYPQPCDSNRLMLPGIDNYFFINQCCLLITFANSLDADQARQKVRPDLFPCCLAQSLMKFKG